LLVAPFAAEPDNGLFADGLTRDVAVGLARLRSVAVIAPASAFALHARGFYAVEAGRTVDADYVVAGRVARHADKVRLTLELIELAHSRLVWADAWTIAFNNAHEAAAAITEQIVSRLVAEIEFSECNRAIVKPAASLSAWEAHHRGLWHLHRFTRADNQAAQGYFERAIVLDPGLSRAYAALSYAHWMNAFAFRPGERAAERDRAFEAACRGLQADSKDPAALWSMSRALWMRNDEVESLQTINRAIELSPSFALARHSRSFVECQTGDAARAIEESRVAQNLSPFDPWRYAMHGVEAFGLVRLGRFEEAATAARRLTRKPNAHVQARGLAALVLVVSGDVEGGRNEIAVVKRLQPRYTVADFFAAYHVATPMERAFRRAAARIGIG
jgi:TolB-like protein